MKTEVEIKRETLLEPLQQVSGIVDRKQTKPILSNVLLDIEKDKLTLTSTDMELQLAAYANLENSFPHIQMTLPCRKLSDICKSLNDNAMLKLSNTDNRCLINSNRSRFTLTTLPVKEFPIVKEPEGVFEVTFSQAELKSLLSKTYFCMAQQDVRYYLNGMLWEVRNNQITVVATDGHRLSLSALEVKAKQAIDVIVPRKAIMEFIRLLSDEDSPVTLFFSPNHITLQTDRYTLISKLIDSQFPDFNKVIPKNLDLSAYIDRDMLKQSLQRVSILCNEKYHGARLFFTHNMLKICANNPEQEEAYEEIDIEFSEKKSIEIAFNINYLIDILNMVPEGNIKFSFKDAATTVIIQHVQSSKDLYVVMPMRL